MHRHPEYNSVTYNNDIAMWRLLGWFKGGILWGLPTDLIDKYPLLSKFWIDMDANPDIRAYMEAKYPPKK